MSLISAQSIDSTNTSLIKTKMSSISEHSELFYSVQIGNYKNEFNQDLLKKFPEIVLCKTSSGSTKYLAGVFPNINACVSTKELAEQNGFEGAFITAYYKGKKITMLEAENLRLGK